MTAKHRPAALDECQTRNVVSLPCALVTPLVLVGLDGKPHAVARRRRRGELDPPRAGRDRTSP